MAGPLDTMLHPHIGLSRPMCSVLGMKDVIYGRMRHMKRVVEGMIVCLR